jgi:hypothetical protein
VKTLREKLRLENRTDRNCLEDKIALMMEAQQGHLKRW